MNRERLEQQDHAGRLRGAPFRSAARSGQATGSIPEIRNKLVPAALRLARRRARSRLAGSGVPVAGHRSAGRRRTCRWFALGYALGHARHGLRVSAHGADAGLWRRSAILLHLRRGRQLPCGGGAAQCGVRICGRQRGNDYKGDGESQRQEFRHTQSPFEVTTSYVSTNVDNRLIFQAQYSSFA